MQSRCSPVNVLSLRPRPATREYAAATERLTLSGARFQLGATTYGSRVALIIMPNKPRWTPGWTRQNLRHVAEFIHQGRNPAARVYESIGSNFFLAPAPGWLNLGLWDEPGSESGAEDACRRLVQTVASALPTDGVILDVGNGLGTQDRLIAEVARPRTLVAVNITEWQLRAGRSSLRAA